MTTSSEQSGDWAVTRRVLTARPLEAELLTALAQLDAQQTGVLAVEGRPGARQLKVRYDATRTDYRSVCQRLEALGAAPRNSRWQRLLVGWNSWLDGNLRENAAAPEGACCNKPPQRRR
jgi:allophanate hydrolase subunit 1